ncbi:MAG: START-like domain-containing protein [Saprospiraceae bacterium]
MAKRVKLQLEYIFRSSPTILFQFLTMPACLVRWFCDEADEQDEFFYFGWNGSVQAAAILDFIEEERLRLRWEDAEPDEYLEYKIYKSPITDETVMEITDFCDETEIKDQTKLWDSTVKSLKSAMGS